MPLREHLLELRRRFTVCLVAVSVGSVAGWFVAERFYSLLLRPITETAGKSGARTQINYGSTTEAFNQRLVVSLLIGVMLTSPIWLYQFWAFITPGLTKKERRYSFTFVGSALPLFFGGATLGWLVLPNAIDFLNNFVPKEALNQLNSSLYFEFVTRIILAFGIAFVLPVVLVGLNMVGLLKGRTVIKHWRLVIFGCFLFSAIANPNPDATSMILLAACMSVLFGIAVMICLLLDRRRLRNSSEPDYSAMADDEASAL